MAEELPVAERARLERDGDLGVLVLDDPPLNLFGAEMVRDILACSGRGATACGPCSCARRASTSRAVPTCTSSRGSRSKTQSGFVAGLMAITHRVEELPFPTLASVHGLCLTAGLELALACDMIWAAEAARFGLVEAVVGLTPLMGGTQRLAERAGPARARELVMSAGLYDAATLERWNVVNRVLPEADLAEKSLRFAKRLAAGPTLAHNATKRIVRAYLEQGVAGADEHTAGIGAPLFETEDLRGAVKSFLAEGPGKASFYGK